MNAIRMINRFKYLILGAVLAVGFGFYTPTEDEDKKDEVILNLIYNVLNSSHFSPREINDDFSEKVFDHYIESLDYSRRFFLQEDIEALEVHRKSIDDQIRRSSLEFFEDGFSRYESRVGGAESYFEEILAEPFDFSIEESFETGEEKLPFASSQEELKERWRRYLKYRVLVRIEERVHDQESADGDSAAAENDTLSLKTFEELEAEAREKELEIHEEWFSNMDDMDHIDWLGMYMNSITNIYDPHTQYFPPQRQEDFEIAMSGQLEGIGAQLSQKGDYVTVAKIITGSACWKQGDLEVGDKILSVAQGDEKDEDPVNLVGMNVRKAVKYIRGPKGTEVILNVQKLDGTKMEISIIRDVVELEATFAKSAILGEGEDKVGYIRLPKFYMSFDNDKGRNCADDVKKELEKFKKENVNGIILDLRNNGGGSLQGVIDIVGLFIEEGPVVQVKSSNRAPRVLKDQDNKIHYDGPLVVMVNQFSASASEIFAAAIQDYNRGLIIGSRSTFGKGTVQNVLDMDRAVNITYRDMKPLGALKLTIQKYYRINGGTPQLRGVEPEIILPDNYNYIDVGEKEQENALPYDEIGSADYTVWDKGVGNYEGAIKNSAQRVKKNPKFTLIDEYAVWLKDQQEDTEVSLNFDTYHKEQDLSRERSEKYQNMRKAEDEIVVGSLAMDMQMWESSEEKTIERDKWFKNLSKDLYLQEAVAVVHDLN
jgi:carboxyl-terminal processing protease